MMYHLRQALLAMRANFTATFSTLTTMTITLLVLGAVLLLTLNVNRTLEQLEAQVEVAAFLKDDANIPALLGQVKLYQGVHDARLVSREQVLAEMTRDYPYARDAAALAGNPFPNTLRMRVERVQDSRRIANIVQALPGVATVEYGANYVDPAVKTLNAIRTAGYGLVALLLLGTLFNILNAVRVAMFARRNEIGVMRLLGATPAFIRMPHLIEGVLVGLIAAVVSVSVLAASYLELAKRVAQLVPVFPIVTDLNTIAPILVGIALLSIVIGLLGSLFATSRYLRELE
ncbi:ABC transporter permease [Deinococcus sp.]|uniref:cell division protein FtsX n=1 Tax=Deinococcus sp. TaxID=47478 RepID=UPI0025C353EB|nr:ABC transporter permease [Deinococcus sp.]